MDTLTILKTMRAVVADVEPERFNIATWFDRNHQCGCIVGLTIVTQPKFAADMNLSLRKRRYRHVIEPRIGKEWVKAERIGKTIGITDREAVHLFAPYGDGLNYGESGKAEAVRRLDEMIAKYTLAVEPERAEPRPQLQTA